MTVIWLSSEFNSLLLTYLVPTFNVEYASGIGFGVADIISFALAGALNSKMGVKRSFNLCWAFATASGLLLTTYGLSHQDSWVFFTLIFVFVVIFRNLRVLIFTVNLLFLTHLHELHLIWWSILKCTLLLTHHGLHVSIIHHMVLILIVHIVLILSLHLFSLLLRHVLLLHIWRHLVLIVELGHPLDLLHVH